MLYPWDEKGLNQDGVYENINVEYNSNLLILSNDKHENTTLPISADTPVYYIKGNKPVVWGAKAVSLSPRMQFLSGRQTVRSSPLLNKRRLLIGRSVAFRYGLSSNTTSNSILISLPVLGKEIIPEMTFFHIIGTFPLMFLHADKRNNLTCFLNIAVDIRISVYDDVDVRT